MDDELMACFPDVSGHFRAHRPQSDEAYFHYRLQFSPIVSIADEELLVRYTELGDGVSSIRAACPRFYWDGHPVISCRRSALKFLDSCLRGKDAATIYVLSTLRLCT